MPPIRIPDVPELPGSAINAPNASFQAANAPNAALGEVAQSIAGVGQHFQEIADDAQKLQNVRRESEIRQGWDADYQNLKTQLQTETDPAAVVSRTKAFLMERRGNVPGDVPPAVRDSLALQFDQFASHATISAGVDSAQLAHKRAGLALQNEFETELDRDNRPGVYNTLDRAGDAGLLLPEEVAARKQDADSRLAVRSIQRAIDADPLGTEKDLESPEYLAGHPDLSPDSIDTLRRQAEVKANRYRSDFANELVINDAQPTEENLATMEAAGQIDKSQHARWLVKIRSAEVAPVSDPAVYEETYARIMGYDAAKDPSGRGEAALRNNLAALSLPRGDLQTLNGKLTERLKPDVSKMPKNIHEADFAAKIGTDFTAGQFGKYRYPITVQTPAGPKLETPINQAAYDAAWKLRGQFSDQWRNIISTLPPDAKFEDVSHAFDALKSSFKDKRPVPDLNFSAPAPLPFDPQKIYQNLPGKRTSFGGVPVKPAGVSYTGAAATVFGGKDDPADNGKSAFGGATGENGREGTAIPQALLASKFPGKSKDWLAENVRTVVRTADGVAHSLPVADLGTAESVWQRNGRPTLDLTPGAAKQLGGKVIYRDGKLAGVKGLNSLDFAVVSTATGKPLEGTTWKQAQADWFQVNRPTSNEQIDNSLIALRDRWARAQMGTAEPIPLSTGKNAPEPLPLARPGESTVIPTTAPASLNTGANAAYNVR